MHNLRLICYSCLILVTSLAVNAIANAQTVICTSM